MVTRQAFPSTTKIRRLVPKDDRLTNGDLDSDHHCTSQLRVLPDHGSKRAIVVPMRIALLLLSAWIYPHSASSQRPDILPYRDSTLSIDTRVRDLLDRMTREEKTWQIFMIPGDLGNPRENYESGIFGFQVAGDSLPRLAAEHINAIQRYFVTETRLGIPIVPFDEAVHGLVRGGATVYPQAIALAATWDTALVGRVARAIASETRSRGIRQVLSPVLNIARDVRWGRVEETYGEDTYLTSVMGLAYVRAMTEAGVIATPKHFVANVGEGGRDSYPIDYSERLLSETYFPAFKVAIKRGGARSIMTSYNSIGGSPATASSWLITEILKEQWSFDGFVISDAAATGGANVLHFTAPDFATSTANAVNAGLDVIFQTSYDHHRLVWGAFERDLIGNDVLDSAVARVLRAKLALGLFENPYVDPAKAATSNGNPQHRALALEAARAAIVLLKNDSAVLPLAKTVTTVAVIGVDAVEARLGGYSGPGNRRISLLDGLRDRLGSKVSIQYTPGPGRTSPTHVPVPSDYLSTIVDGSLEHGLSASYYDNIDLSGPPRVTRTDPRIDFGWTLNSPHRDIPYDWYSVRWTGTISAPSSGAYHLGVEGNDGYRLFLDDSLIIDNWHKRSYGVRLANVSLTPGASHALRLEYFESTGNARVKLVWDAGVRDDWQGAIERAVTAARTSDVAVIVAGIEEGEFRDRASLALPGRQEDLIRAVADAGRPVIVVIVGGSAVKMTSWLDRVAAVVDVWYPGEAGGYAIADVLIGDHNPSGRLPITFPITEGQLPLYYAHKPTGRGDDYLDATGQPLFPFGFGLSYTTFAYRDLVITPSTIQPGDSVVVRCLVRNTGARAGDEVVQLYVRDLVASVAQPVMALKDFARIHLLSGEEHEVRFVLGPDDLSLLNPDMQQVVEPGDFRIMVGASSKDIRLRGFLTVQPITERDR
jgi:beta-glucosidase